MSSRAARRAAYAAATRALTDARQAIDGVLGVRANLLLTPLAEQHARVANGADPEVFTEPIAQGRELLRRCLIAEGRTGTEADTLIARLETAHAVWLATPER